MEKRYLIIPGTIILLIVIGALISRNRVLAAPEQPVHYSHKAHISNGIQCLYCHADASRSEIAGIPSMEKCAGCHSYIANESEAVQVVMSYWEQGEPIPWERVNHQPEFVYFSHQPHILSGINCESCHGDVGNMDAAKPVVRMDMGWCLDCHLEQPEEDQPRLIDCLTCHK